MCLTLSRPALVLHAEGSKTYFAFLALVSHLIVSDLPCDTKPSPFLPNIYNIITYVIQFNSCNFLSVPDLSDTKGMKNLSNHQQKGLTNKEEN